VVREQLTSARRELAAITSNRDDLDIAEDLAQSVTIARAESRAAAALLTVTKLGDHAVSVDGADTCTSEFAITADTVVEVDGVVRVSISPGGESATLAARLAGAERALSGFLAERGVGDVAELRAQVRKGERAADAVDSLRSQLSAILGDRDEDTVRAEGADLAAQVDTRAAPTSAWDVDEAEQLAGTAAARQARSTAGRGGRRTAQF
jgi:hypothetical protein